VEAPRVAFDTPAGWVATEIDKPPIAESSGARFVQWQAARSASDDAALAVGCVATPIPGWIEDMRPAVEARTVALAGAVAARITGAPVDARVEDGSLALRAANDLGGPLVGRAQSFVGFDDAHVVTCVATCAATGATRRHEPARGPTPDASTSDCPHVIAGARLEAALPPPKPGVGLRAATWAVHHPRPVALGGLGLVVLVGILAVVGRRRPRSQIERPARHRN